MRRQSNRGDELLLAALASGLSAEEAAKRAGMSRRTVYRRLADPAFRRRLAGARDALVSEALGELAATATAAVATLRELLDARDERVRLGASRAVLEQLLRVREAVSLAERVAELERRVEARGRSR